MGFKINNTGDNRRHTAQLKPKKNQQTQLFFAIFGVNKFQD